jgi:hypothetical protein
VYPFSLVFDRLQLLLKYLSVPINGLLLFNFLLKILSSLLDLLYLVDVAVKVPFRSTTTKVKWEQA